MSNSDPVTSKVRLDKWLWAARFFKTRALAKQAITGGKVQIDGQRPKCAREITEGTCLQIRQGWDEKTVVVTGLSDQRRGASEAEKLYSETEESIEKRNQQATARKLAHDACQPPRQRPTKKQRQQIHRFRQDLP